MRKWPITFRAKYCGVTRAENTVEIDIPVNVLASILEKVLSALSIPFSDREFDLAFREELSNLRPHDGDRLFSEFSPTIRLSALPTDKSQPDRTSVIVARIYDGEEPLVFKRLANDTYKCLQAETARVQNDLSVRIEYRGRIYTFVSGSRFWEQALINPQLVVATTILGGMLEGKPGKELHSLMHGPETGKSTAVRLSDEIQSVYELLMGCMYK